MQKKPNHPKATYRLIPLWLVLFWLIWTGLAQTTVQAQPKMTRPEQGVLHEAQQLIKKKAYAAAQNKLETFISQQPGKQHYLLEFTLANSLSQAGQPQAALSHYRKAVALYPEDAAVWQNMGTVLYQLKRYEAAGESLAKAYSLSGTAKKHELLYQAAGAYMLAKQPRRARPLLEKIVSTTKLPDERWLETLLQAYLELGLSQKALTTARTLLQGKEVDSKLWPILTRLYIDTGAFKEAAAAFEIHLLHHPASTQDLKLLGDLYQQAKVPLEAARQYERLLDLTGQEADVEKTARAYAAAHHHQEAITILNQRLAKAPTAGLWWLIATLYYETDAFEDAYEALAHCIASDPNRGEAYLLMGYSATYLGRMRNAQEAFRQASRFDPQRKEALARLDVIDGLMTVSTQAGVQKENDLLE